MDHTISFRQWLAEVAPVVAPGVPGAPKPGDMIAKMKEKGAKDTAVRAAAVAVQRGQNPKKAMQQTLVNQAMRGQLDPKQLAKLIPDE